MISEQTKQQRGEMQKLVWRVNRTAVGDSNDDEIAALREALDHALIRWPTIDTEGRRHKHKRFDDGGHCKGCGFYNSKKVQ